MNQKPFPIPIVSDRDVEGLLGPGSQEDRGELEYLNMPKGMNTFTSPVMPEPQEIGQCTQAATVLQQCLDLIALQLQAPTLTHQARTKFSVNLMALPAADMQVINQVLSEGEVAVTVGQDQVNGQRSLERHVQIQESVFAGVWRVLEYHLGQLTQDYLEVGAIPQVVMQAAKEDSFNWKAPTIDPSLAQTFINVNVLLTEINDKSENYRAGTPAHTINLSLLPVSKEDISYLDHRIGTGNVVILSRGYGNCRIVNSGLSNTWRVVYYNSQDVVILNTVEIVDLPEAALAARQDLIDSQERLHTILAWLDS